MRVRIKMKSGFVLEGELVKILPSYHVIKMGRVVFIKSKSIESVDKVYAKKDS